MNEWSSYIQKYFKNVYNSSNRVAIAGNFLIRAAALNEIFDEPEQVISLEFDHAGSEESPMLRVVPVAPLTVDAVKPSVEFSGLPVGLDTVDELDATIVSPAQPVTPRLVTPKGIPTPGIAPATPPIAGTTPGSASPGAIAPGAGSASPGAGATGAGGPGAGSPGAGAPGAGIPGTGTPGTGTPGTGTPGTGTPGAGSPGGAAPTAGSPGTTAPTAAAFTAPSSVSKQANHYNRKALCFERTLMRL